MNEKLHHIQIVFIVFMVQTGVTIFSLPRVVAESFGTNGWLAIVFVSAVVCISLFLIYLVYKKGNGESVFVIWEKRIPKILLLPIYVTMIVNMGVLAIMLTKVYSLLIKLMLFKEINTNILVVLILISVLFFLSKGIYNVAKITTAFFFITIFYIFVFPLLFPEFSFTRMTPFFFQGDINIWKGFVDIYKAFIGFCVALFIIPYVEKQTHFGKAIFFGHFLTTIAYLLVCIISFGFFSFEQMKQILYPVLMLLKYVQTPVIERVENITFSVYILSIIVSVAFYYWISVQFLRRFFRNTSERRLTFIIVVITFLLSLFFEKQREIDFIMNIHIYPFMFMSFFLPIFTLFCIKLNKRVEKK